MDRPPYNYFYLLALLLTDYASVIIVNFIIHLRFWQGNWFRFQRELDESIYDVTVFLVLTWQSAPFFLAESGSLYCLVSPSHIGVHTFPGENLKTEKTCTPDVLFTAVVQVVYYYLHLTRPDVCFNYVILFPYHNRNRIQTPGISASQL